MKLGNLIARNCKIYFKDKALFFSSLIAPLILFFLFVAFLGNVYRDSLLSILPKGVVLPKSLIEGFAGGWLMSSLISVCTVSISFTSNMIMVQDKVEGRIFDFKVSPVKDSTLAFGYYISTALVTSVICFSALIIGFIYIAIVGWYLSAVDVILIIVDTLLLIMFGTALSSIVCRFLKSQGAITAVEVIVSAAYGFLCGAYMPLSSLTKVIASALMFLPGTYGTALLHEHFMGGSIDKVGELTSIEYAGKIRQGFDCSLDFFGTPVKNWVCFAVIGVTVALLVGIFIMLCMIKIRKKNKK